MQDKKMLREKFSEIRSSIAQKQAKDCHIAARFIGEKNLLSKSDIILMYASFGSEPDTWIIADKLLRAGKNLAFPRCEKNGIMTFHIVSSLDMLKEGVYGIREPESFLPVPDISDGAICIIPGLAFTENGGRLGYGGGYYDRFLSANKNVYKVAVTYEELIVPTLPLMEHDVRADIIITEERTVFCNGR